MTKNTSFNGEAELRAARRESRMLYWAVGIFSFFVNTLMLTGPLYMMNVYDRVLGSRSLETLIALSVLVTFLYVTMSVLDIVRGRIMGRIGARFQARLDERVFSASIRGASLGKAMRESQTGLRDLESVQRLITSPALMAAFDLPFSPIFFAGIFVFHAWMGYMSLASAGVLIILAIANQLLSKRPLETANAATMQSEMTGNQIRQEAELVQALGMRGAAFTRWQFARTRSLDATIGAADVGGSFNAIIKGFRLFVQSAMLGLGAYLVLENQMSSGAMIAGSILLGRALSPIESIVGQWALFQRAREGWTNLAVLLSEIPVEPRRMSLPVPRAFLEAVEVA